ncbi:hypothetical protein [Rubrivirga sp.]|uniref:hypothetical protein n=1 Tax=Rubrivirga sp. TaxID=1885344 RepID=UPI003C71FCA3
MIVCAVPLLVLGACSSASLPDQRPADFALEYGRISGSVPPPSDYTRLVEVDPSGAGALTVAMRYVPGDREVTVPFVPDAVAMDRLYQDVAHSGAFVWRLRDAEPSPGSSPWWVAVAVDDRVIEASVLSSGGYKAGMRLRAIVDATLPADVLEVEQAFHGDPRRQDVQRRRLRDAR